MAIITISSGSYSRGKEVAEKVAQKLGFECVARDILVEASEEFNVPEIKLLRAFRDAPSIFDRFTFGKEKFNSYIQTTLLECFQRDNVVYHGLAGHYFVSGVSHVLKVRILDKMEERVERVMRREAVLEQAASAMRGLVRRGLTRPGIHSEVSKERALRIVNEADEARRQWGLYLYGIETTDSSIYDLVIHINKLSADDAADIVCDAAGLNHFQATGESQQTMDDLLLATRVKARLVESYPQVQVTANEGVVHVGLEAPDSHEGKAIQEGLADIPGIKHIEMKLYPRPFF